MTAIYRVQDIMTRKFVAIGPQTSIDDAISKILEYGVSGLPVVDAKGILLGVISEIDIIDLVYEADIETSRVGDHMTRDVQCLDPEASLDDAAGQFCSQSIRRFPVTREGRLVGILSRRDLIRFLRDVRRGTVSLA
jgi:CBS domain-containing protein